MAAGPPDLRGHDDGGFKADDVVALAGHGLPPKLFHVALEFRAHGAVVPKTVDASVDFGRLKNEAAPFAQRDDFFHERIFFWLGHEATVSGFKGRFSSLDSRATGTKMREFHA